MKIAVIGGGASGMMAALTAGLNGQDVLLFEKQARVGRKLMATGNGRCNLTNLHAQTDRYHGEDPAFVRPAFEALDVANTLSFFSSIGLVTTTEDDGKVYPMSDQAGSVVDVLRLSCEEAGVTLLTDAAVTGIRREQDGFLIKAGDTEYPVQKVIVACGGAAGKHLGGSYDGYELLKSLGHTATPVRPCLVQMKTDTTFVRALKGIRAVGSLTLRQNETVLLKNSGEIQFTEYGISGPAVFEMSHKLMGQKGLVMTIDFMPQMTSEEIDVWLQNRQKQMPGQVCDNLLVGMLQNRLGKTVLRASGIDGTKFLADLTASERKAVAKTVKHFDIPVEGTLGFEHAQVTAGGIKTGEFSSATLQSKLIPGLYACGEVLDIDGDCGGFNLQWAWSSGYLAGLLK